MAVILKSALIISTGEKNAQVLTSILTTAAYNNITTVTNAGDARRMMIESDFDLCIINAPLTDESGEKLAENIALKGIVGVILIVKTDYYDEICEKVENYGVITVSKPLNKVLLWNAIKLAGAAHIKMQMIQDENNKLLQKIEDIRIVDRAKCLLISYLSMSEDEAHRYIEKQAMDMRITKRQVADKVLKTYDY